MPFADPELIEPTIHCFARCYWCKRLVPLQANDDGLVLDERPCPGCGTQLTEARILDSFVENFLHTSAITSANKFISFDLAVVPFMVVSLLITYMEYPLSVRVINLLVYHAPIALCIRWFKRYWYDVRFDDDDYLEAVSRMRKLLILWSVANTVNWCFILLQWLTA